MEKWVKIKNYCNYEVSDFGRVRSIDRIVYDKKGRATISINGRTKNIGRFDTELEAHEAYQKELERVV